MTNENYDVAVKVIREKFGKNYAITESLYTSIQQLPTTLNRFSDMKKTHETMEKTLRQLEAKGENVSEQRPLIPQMLSKFSKEVINKLEESKGADDPWTVDSLREALKKYTTVQENAQRHLSMAKGRRAGCLDTVHHNSQTLERADEPTVRASAEALTTSTSKPNYQIRGNTSDTQKSLYPCIFCSGNHFNEDYDQFNKSHLSRLPHEGRKEMYEMWENRGHHNRAICPKTVSTHMKQEVTSVAADPPQDTSVNTNITQTMASGERVLLQIATVEVSNPEGKVGQSRRAARGRLRLTLRQKTVSCNMTSAIEIDSSLSIMYTFVSYLQGNIEYSLL